MLHEIGLGIIVAKDREDVLFECGHAFGDGRFAFCSEIEYLGALVLVGTADAHPAVLTGDINLAANRAGAQVEKLGHCTLLDWLVLVDGEEEGKLR